MKYATAIAFRQALEGRINREAQEQALSHNRLRKLIVFDRFLARLLAVRSDGWVLKGGVALNLRWERYARSTRDLDLGRQDTETDATEHLIAAASLDLNDFFAFAVERTRKLDALIEGSAIRYHVTAQLAGRRFDDVIVDVGFGDPFVPEPDAIPGITLLTFAGIPRLVVPTISLEQHLAEKLHAYTRSYGSGVSSTRVKDLVDLVLGQQYGTPHAGRLRMAIENTFNSRGVQSISAHLPPPPHEWNTAYRRLAQEVGLREQDDGDVMQADHQRVARFLEPILDGMVQDDWRWDTARRQWTTAESQES